MACCISRRSTAQIDWDSERFEALCPQGNSPITFESPVDHCFFPIGEFGGFMGWQGAPNFDDIAEHLLAIIDVWNSPDMSAAPFGRVDAVTSMFRICFGNYRARSVAADVLADFDQFDEQLSEDRCEPDHYERKKYLTLLLLGEFAKRGGSYMTTG